jgi:uncharacterized protein YlxW (UPF0749 family)
MVDGLAGEAVENGIESPPVAQSVAAEALAPRHSDYAWVWQVTALSLVLGVMLALALRTTDHLKKYGLPSHRFGVSPAILAKWKVQNEDLEREIGELRDRVSEFRASAQNGESPSKVLRKQVQEMRAFVGLGAVRGTGLRITLRNSPGPILPGTEGQAQSYLVNEQDVNGLVSELWAAGAEAAALSGAGSGRPERFVVTTTVRSDGRGVVANGTVLSPPFEITAIGNRKDLRAALEMPEGIIQTRGLDILKMIVIEEASDLVLPAYTGARGPTHAQAPNR